MLKTIRSTDPSSFDIAVNRFLKDGWSIVKLEAVKGDKVTTMVAFLFKEE